MLVQVHNLVLYRRGPVAFLQVHIELFQYVYRDTPGDALRLHTKVCSYSFRVGDTCYLTYNGDASQFLADCGTCALDFYDIPAVHIERHEDLPMHLDYRAAPCVLCGAEFTAL